MLDSREFSQLADVLAARGKRDLADRLLAEQLAKARLSPAERLPLLHKRIELQADLLSRGKLRLEVISLLTADSKERKDQAESLLDEQESNPPENIGRLAELANGELRARLWLRQAQFEGGPGPAADLIWKSHVSGHLPAHKLLWACERLAAADQPARVVRICETQLRQGEILSLDVLGELTQAYRELGRPTDAKRAAMQDPLAVAPAARNN